MDLESVIQDKQTPTSSAAPRVMRTDVSETIRGVTIMGSNEMENLAAFQSFSTQEETNNEAARIRNAEMLAAMLRIDVKQAYEMEPQLVTQLYPTRTMSSENFSDKMTVVFQQATIMDKIAEYRYKQLFSGDAGAYEDEILKLKASLPEKSVMEDITEGLKGDFPLLEKVKTAVKSVPYVAAGQVPHFLGALEEIGLGAAAGAGIGAIGGNPLGGAFTGAMIGQTYHSFVLESGSIYDGLITQFQEAGEEVDYDLARNLSLSGGALIAAVDSIGLLFGGKQVLSAAPFKELAKETLEKFTSASFRLAANASGKIAAAGLGEGITEGAQEVIADLVKNQVIKLQTMAVGSKVQPKDIKDILIDAGAVAAMSIPLALATSGAGASLNFGTQKFKESIKYNVEKKVETRKATTEEMKRQTQTNSEIVDIYKTDPNQKREPDVSIGGKVADLENDLIDSENYKRPDGLYVAEQTMEFDGSQGRNKISFTTKKDGHIEFQANKGSVTGFVYQGSDGINVHFQNLPTDLGLKDSINSAILKSEISNQIIKNVYEGTTPNDIYIAANISDHITNLNAYENNLDNTPIEYLSDTIKDSLEIAQELKEAINDYLPGSREQRAIQETLYNYLKVQDRYNNIASTATSTVEKVEAVIKNDSIPVSVRAKLQMIMDKTGTRMTFTESQKDMLYDINEKHSNRENITGKESGIRYTSGKEKEVDYTAHSKKSMRQLSPREIALLVNKMQAVGLFSEISLAQEGLSVESTISVIKKEVGHIEDPTTVMEEITERKRSNLLDKAKKLLVLDSRQFHFLAGFMFGEQSLFYNVVYRQMRVAENNKNDLKRDLNAHFGDAIKRQGINLKQVEEFFASKFQSQEGAILTMDDTLSIYLNYKCEDNRRSMLEHGVWVKSGKKDVNIKGESFFNEVKQAILTSDTGIAIADAMSETFDLAHPHVSLTYEQMNGKPMAYIKDYFPMTVKEDVYTDANIIKKDKDANLLSFQWGSMIERTSETKSIVIKPATEVFDHHINQSAAYATGEKAMFMASQVLGDSDIKTAIENKTSEDHYKLLVEALERHSGKKDPVSTLDEVAGYFKNKATKAVIGANLFSAAKAPISWTYGLRYIKPQYMMKGLKALTLKTKETQDFMLANSPAMRKRQESGAGTSMQDALKHSQLEHLRGKKKTLDEHLFTPIRFMDMQTTTSVGFGAYLQAMDEIESGVLSNAVKNATGLTGIVPTWTMEQKSAYAILFADDVINKTQPAVSDLNKNKFQTGNALGRTYSAFSGFTNITQNMMDEVYHAIKEDGGKAAPVAAGALGLFLLQGLGSAGVDYLKEEILGREHNTHAWTFIGDLMFGNTYLVRDAWGTAKSKAIYGSFAGGKDGSLAMDRIMIVGVSAIFDLIDGSGMTGGDVDNRKLQRGMESLAETVALTSGLPMSLRYGVELAQRF